MNKVQAFRISNPLATPYRHISNPLARMLTINANCVLVAKTLDSINSLLSFFDTGGGTSDLKHLFYFIVNLSNMVQIRTTTTAAHPFTFPTLHLSAPYAAIRCHAVILLKRILLKFWSFYVAFIQTLFSSSIPANKDISFVLYTRGNSVSESNMLKLLDLQSGGVCSLFSKLGTEKSKLKKKVRRKYQKKVRRSTNH